MKISASVKILTNLQLHLFLGYLSFNLSYKKGNLEITASNKKLLTISCGVSTKILFFFQTSVLKKIVSEFQNNHFFQQLGCCVSLSYYRGNHMDTFHVSFLTCVPCTECRFFCRILELHDLG